MKSSPNASSPDDYLANLKGWRRACVDELRTLVRGVTALDEVVKWGHLVYYANGPVLLIRAEEERVLFGFWRGQRLRGLEPRLKPGVVKGDAVVVSPGATAIDGAKVLLVSQR